VDLHPLVVVVVVAMGHRVVVAEQAGLESELERMIMNGVEADAAVL
jgi:hypothetical protein